MAGAALLFAGTSATLDLMGGLFGHFAAQQAAGIAESRGRMIRLEAEADAQRYAEQARGFKATQKLAFLKSGVDLSGSPLDILDHDMLAARENIAAIRARGAAGQLEQQNLAEQTRSAGRSALLSGISSGVGKLGVGLYQHQTAAKLATQNRRDTEFGGAGRSTRVGTGQEFAGFA